VRIEVADQGVGIAAADIPRIFDRFYQVDSSPTRRHGGTGMGLALVKRMVHAHGATVTVESTLGEGTAVALVWPTSPASSSGEARAVAEERGEPPRPRRPARRRAVPVQ
jgi:signal transduction histidine kinase